MRDLRPNLFTKAEMQRRLPKPVFKSVTATIEHSKPLDPTVADVVASAMKDAAMQQGPTQYAQILYPLTNLVAEKHDSFFEIDNSARSQGFLVMASLARDERSPRRPPPTARPRTRRALGALPSCAYRAMVGYVHAAVVRTDVRPRSRP